MAQKPEDFNLPISAISKIVKDAIPEGVCVTDVAKLALSKAASVFVLFATSSANSLSQDANRKRLLAKDVIDALNDLDLDFLVPPLNSSLSAYRKTLETKKQAKVFKKNDSQRDDDDDEDDDVEEMDTSRPDVITLESESESEKEDTNNENDTYHKNLGEKQTNVKKNGSQKEDNSDIKKNSSQTDIIILESDSESGEEGSESRSDSDISII